MHAHAPTLPICQKLVIQIIVKGIIQGGYCEQYARRQIKRLHKGNNHLRIY